MKGAEVDQGGENMRREDSSLTGGQTGEAGPNRDGRGWPGSPGEDFFAIQAGTGWGQVLSRFAVWCEAQPGWWVLDVGSGPGLLPLLFTRQGCRAFGVDLDPAVLRSERLHPDLLMASVLHLPFPAAVFELVTASNLLFFLPQPERALREMRRVLWPGGRVALINPSERMSTAAAAALANRRGLQGVARASLLNWAKRAEAHHRWGEADLRDLFAAANLNLVNTDLQVGPGLARFALGALL